MKEYFNNLKITSIIFGLIYLFFGLSLIIWQETAKVTMLVLFGVAIIVFGVMCIVNYFIYGFEPFGFFVGVINIVLGALTIVYAGDLSNAGVFAGVFAFVFMLSAIFKLQNSFVYRRFGVKNWWIETVFGVIMLVLSIVIICNPFAESVLFTFLGVGIIADAIMQIIATFVIANKIKKIKHSFRELFTTKNDDDVIEL